MRQLLILSSVLIATGAAEAQGQNKPAPSKTDSSCRTFSDGRVECTKVRGRMPGDSAWSRMFYRADSALMNRAALGLELRATGTRRDTLGVFVAAVTPRGPAETAGIIEGDRIAAINGIDLRSAAADVDDAYTSGIPAHRLSREVRKLTPGTRVTLRVYSAGRFRDVVVTTGRASEVRRHAGEFNFRRLGPGSDMGFRGFDGPRIRVLPRKMLRRAGPSRVESLTPGTVVTPDEIRELDSEILFELDRVPMDEVEVLTESLPDLELIPAEERQAIELEAEIET